MELARAGTDKDGDGSRRLGRVANAVLFGDVKFGGFIDAR